MGTKMCNQKEEEKKEACESLFDFINLHNYLGFFENYMWCLL